MSHEQTYPDQNEGDTLRPLLFTRRNIEELGQIDDVLERFLSEQVNRLEQELSQNYTEIPESWSQMLLDQFITEEGTKRPIVYIREKGVIRIPRVIMDSLPPVSQFVLSDTLKGLETRRIIRFRDDNTMELAHDSLAELIDQRRSDEQRMRAEALKVIKVARSEGEFLSEKVLNKYESVLPVLSLNEDIRLFIEQSNENIKQEKKEVLVRQKKEIISERRKIWIRIMAVLAILALSAGAFASYQKIKLDVANAQLKKGAFDQARSDFEYLKTVGKYPKAEEKLNYLDSMNSATVRPYLAQDSLDRMQEDLSMLWRLIAEGDTLFKQKTLTGEHLLLAKEKYEDALRIEETTLIQEKIARTNDGIQQYFEKWMKQAQTAARQGKQVHAKDGFRVASKLIPEEDEILSLEKNYPWLKEAD